MYSTQPMSLWARLQLLVLVAIIPLVALLAYTNIVERRRDLAAARNDTHTGVQFIRSILELKLEETHDLLLALAQLGELRRNDPTACAARLTEFHSWYSDYAELGYAGPQGAILCSSSIPRSVFADGRPKEATWFQRAVTRRAFSMGDYQVEPGTGRPLLTFGLPILDSEGNVQGVVYAVSYASQLYKLSAGMQSPPLADVLILDRNGTILDRQPQVENWAGKTLTRTPLIQTILTHHEGTAEMNGIDGVSRMYAFAPVSHPAETGLYVCVGTPTEAVYAEANQTLLFDALALIPIIALALITASFFANGLLGRNLTGLMEAAQRLRRGDLSARSPTVSQTVELDQLAQTFNETASALEQREAQHQVIEDNLREQHAMLHTTLTSMGDAVIIIDARGRVTFLNPLAETLTGWTQDEAAGQRLDDVLVMAVMDSAQARVSLMTEVLRDGATVASTGQALLNKHSDQTVAIDMSGAPIRRGTGKISGAVFVFRDIAQRLRAEQLSRSTRAQQLLSEVARLLATSLDDESRLAKVAKLLIPELADWCQIEVIAGDQTVRRVAAEHSDPAGAALAEELYRRYPPDWNAPGGAADVLRSGQTKFFPDLRSDISEAEAGTSQHLKILRELGFSSAISVPLNAYGLTLGVLTLARSATSRPHTADDVALAEEVAVRCALALDNARLYQAESAARAAAEVAQQRLAFLAGASRILMSSTDVSTQVDSLAQYIVPTFADWCAINLREPDGSIRLAAVNHRDPDKIPRISELVQRFPSDSAVAGTLRVVRTGLPEISSRMLRDRSGLVDDLDDYEHLLGEIGFKSHIIVPLKARGTVSGTLLVVSENAGRPYSQADLTLAEELAAYAALAIDSARTYEESQQLNTELDQRVKERTALLQANNEKLQEQIAERLRAETELAEVQRQRAQGREIERAHLARELHDGPVQDLYGISYRLAVTKDSLPKSAAGEQFAAAQTELQRVIHTLRNISSELRPTALTSFGLKVAIQAHAERFQSAHPELRLQLDLASDRQRLSEEARLALFRIYQQTLANVVRHARAQQVTVRLNLDDKLVTLEIQDDGQGFEVPRRWIDLARQGHLGLIGAAERAEALDGTLQVHSTPGESTRITVSLPLDAGQSNNAESQMKDEAE